MQEKDLAGSTINELIISDTCRAAVLHQLGIPFYEFQSSTLSEVCQIKGIRLDHVIRELTAPVNRLHPDEKLLITYPAELIIGCLKHAHGVFMRHKLPYIQNLIQHAHTTPPFHGILSDLRLLFPVFTQEFVQHIHMEEDTLFDYIEQLTLVVKRKLAPTRIYYRMEKESINRFITEHEAHDDEMEGIRKITDHYQLDPDSPLPLKVLYNELQSLENDLKEHARIENEILFPKAITLEGRINKMMTDAARLN